MLCGGCESVCECECECECMRMLDLLAHTTLRYILNVAVECPNEFEGDTTLQIRYILLLVVPCLLG